MASLPCAEPCHRGLDESIHGRLHFLPLCIGCVVHEQETAQGVRLHQLLEGVEHIAEMELLVGVCHGGHAVALELAVEGCPGEVLVVYLARV